MSPSAVSSRIAETEQLHQAQANDWRNRQRVALSICSQTEKVHDPTFFFFFGELLWRLVRTLRELFLASRTGDLLPSRVYVQNALRV